MPRLLLTALLALACVVPLSAAQNVGDGDERAGAESELARVQRDQSRIGLRITSLREKMERLAQRYEDEGRTRNATLLREALAEFDGRQVQDVARELERNLQQSNLSSVEQQDALVGSLEDIYAVLRDRRDADELARQADLARAAVQELSILARNQRRLLSETRAATDAPGDLLARALELAAQLRGAVSAAESAAQAAQAREAELGDSGLADALAQEQRALAQDADATAQTQALLEEALALLRERLGPASGADPGSTPEARESSGERGERGQTGATGQPGTAGSDPQSAPAGESASATETAPVGEELLAAAEAARDEAREAAAAAAEAMAEARERLQRAESGGAATAGTPAAPTESSGGDRSGEAAGEASAGASGEASGEASAETAGAPSGEASAETSGEAASEASGKAQGRPQGEAPAPAPEAGAEASPEEAERKAARQAMQAAAVELEQTRDALERAERSVGAARNRARALALASSEDAARQADDLKELAERLEAVDPEQGPELLDRTRALLEELQKLREDVQQSDAAGAAARAQAARASIDDLLAQLRARAGAAGAEDEAARTADPEDLAALAAQQAELQRQVRELMARLEDLPDQQFQEPAARAAQSMAGAESALRSGRTDEAAVREEEAAEQLEKAQQQLAGERDRYEQLRQEEVLFRIGEELVALLEQHDAATAETLELDSGRGESERLGRSQRRAVTRLAAQERGLSVRAETVRAALEEDGAVVFTFSLARCRDELLAVADKLDDEQTGVLVQAAQAEIHQRLVDLLAVLEQEQQRRREARSEPPPEGQEQQQNKPQLVPTVAELLLIQRMEQAALARLEAFERLNPGLAEADGLAPAERELLERWALDHVRVTELFRSLVPTGEPPAGPAGAPAAGGAPGGGPEPGGSPEEDEP